MRALRFLPALALLALAVALALLAADVRSWQRTLTSDDARRSGATWNAPARIPWSLAERLLGVGDDVRARRAIALFERNVSVRARLDNELAVAAARARAESALAAVARGRGPRASQAATLLGILAFRDLAEGGGRDPSQAEAATADFQNAVRADQLDETAKYDLELLLRALEARGVRTGSNGGAGAGPAGRTGAGGGTPGHGY